LNIRKILFAGKLALGLTLGLLVVRTVLLPGQMERAFAPASALGEVPAWGAKSANLPALSPADYAGIVERNPFADAGRDAAKAAGYRGADGTVSGQLGLVLLGTVSGSPAVARAVIRNVETNGIDLYKTGQTLGAALIEAIEKEQVILLVKGERKVLKLGTSQPQQRQNLTETKLPGSTGRAEVNPPAEDTVTVLRTKLRRVDAILKKATIKPHIVDGRVDGLQLTGLEKIEAARQLGLRNGDVIRVVNGQRLTDKQKAYQVFMKARSQPVINLELLRGGRARKLSFVLR